MVCHGVQLRGKEKRIGKAVHYFLLFNMLLIGILSLPFANNVLLFLLCMGREEHFVMDLENPHYTKIKGVGIALPFFHPYRLLVNVTVFAFFLIVPFLYLRIFTFRWTHDSNIKGISLNLSKILRFHPTLGILLIVSHVSFIGDKLLSLDHLK